MSDSKVSEYDHAMLQTHTAECMALYEGALMKKSHLVLYLVTCLLFE